MVRGSFFEVSGKSKEVKVADAAYDSLNLLQQIVGRLHDDVRQPDFLVNQDAVKTALELDGARRATERIQSRALDPSQLAFVFCLVVSSQSISQKFVQTITPPKAG
jgi:hypothetical protein